MSILVTGGTGFIGSALVRRLLIESNGVRVLARGKRKLDTFLEEKLEMYRIDIADLISLESTFSSIKSIDVIFHLAACTDYKVSKEKLFKTNVTGTLNLLNLAVRHRVRKFVYISSIEAIGPIKKGDIPADESYVCHPVTSYGESKLEAERYVMRFGSERKLETVVLRLGNVYGPRSLSFILPIATAILNKDKKYLYVMRDQHTWHPVYIDDVIDGIIKAVVRKAMGDIYILTGAEYASVKFLSQLIAQELNTDIRTLELNRVQKLYLSLRGKVNKLRYCFIGSAKERIRWAYSIEKAKRELGYFPKVNLEEGIARTIDWARQEGLLKR